MRYAWIPVEIRLPDGKVITTATHCMPKLGKGWHEGDILIISSDPEWQDVNAILRTSAGVGHLQMSFVSGRPAVERKADKWVRGGRKRFIKNSVSMPMRGAA